MLDFSAYLAAQQLTQGAVTEALCDAPVRPNRVPVARRSGVVAARQRIGLTLCRLADVIAPARSGMSMPLPASR